MNNNMEDVLFQIQLIIFLKSIGKMKIQPQANIKPN